VIQKTVEHADLTSKSEGQSSRGLNLDTSSTLIRWALVAVRAMTRASPEPGEEVARTVLDAPTNHWEGPSIVSAWMRKSKQQRNRLYSPRTWFVPR
jgi:hypothetical protein